MSTAPSTTISDALAAVRERIGSACDRCGRDPREVTLIGVTKTRPAKDVVDAVAAGLTDFGENYVQEGRPKFEEARLRTAAPFGRHFIGHLQRNKVNDAVDAFDVIHSIDSLRLLEAVGHRAMRNVSVFIQVNLAGEASKSGAALADVSALVDRARSMEPVTLLGLMTVPPPGPAEAARPWFRQLRELARSHGLSHLSMGMTDDFDVAIEEGATHIRVGRAIFGERLL